MVTKIGTAKQTVQQNDKAIAWLLKCVEDGIAPKKCEAAVAVLVDATLAIAEWIKEQS